jgi:hypothetical protein
VKTDLSDFVPGALVQFKGCSYDLPDLGIILSKPDKAGVCRLLWFRIGEEADHFSVRYAQGSSLHEIVKP